MPNRYPVTISGFENQKIELESSGFFSPSKLFVDGKKAEPGNKKNELIIQQRNGRKVSVFFQNAFFDTVPRLMVDGKTIIVVPSLKWYQYVVSGLTLFLVFFGGALGAILGMIAFLMSIRILRSHLKNIQKYCLIFAIHAITMAIYIALSLLITVMTSTG
jgi:hypothetical protein